MALKTIEYNISEWMVNPAEISIESDDRVSMRVKRNIYKNLRRSWEDIHIIDAVVHYLSHVKIWEDFLNKEGDFCCVLDKMEIDKSHIFNHGDFDIFLLDYKNVEMENETGDIKNFRGLNSYIISRKCINRLIKYLYPIQVKLDSFICIYKEIFGLKIVADLKYVNVSKDKLKFLEDDCPLCDLPNNWNKDNVLIEKWDYYLGRIIQCGVLVAGVYLLASP